jgi:DNA primase
VALFPQTFIDDLRLQANIVQVVQEYVPLKKAGRTYKGLCPFHGEKTPSFTVDPDKGFFHCFGCNRGGDVFKFIELQESLSFPEAVRLVASKFGVSLPESSDGTTDDAQRRDAALRETLLKAHEIAAAYFGEQLAGPAGGRARQQLKDRGLSAKTIEQLGLGFAPQTREGLKERLLKQGFTPAVLLQSGLIVQRDSGEVVDRFRNRLIVPICRDTGSVIAFGGRQMDADQGGPKYLNSPETPIYSKSRTLYGLNLTKAAIRKQGYALIVEGYFDFGQVYQSGAFSEAGAPVVASCGTALTTQQAQLLKRSTTNVKLNFDPDSAGQSAATRSCDLLVREGFEVKVVMLDKGQDPDTFIRTRGDDEYRAKLRDAVPYLEYVARREASQFDLRSAAGRNDYLAKMASFSQLLTDDASKELFAGRVAEKVGVTDATVLTQFRRSFTTKTVVKAPILPSFGELKKAEKDLIWAVIHSSVEALAALHDLEPEDLENLRGQAILEMARSLQKESDFGRVAPEHLPSTLLQRLSTVDAQLVTGIAATANAPAPPAACVQAIKRLRWERERATIQREIDRLQQLGATQHEHEIDDLWQRKKDLLHRIEQLT